MLTDVPAMTLEDIAAEVDAAFGEPTIDMTGSVDAVEYNDEETYRFEGQTSVFSPLMTLVGDQTPGYHVLVDFATWDEAEEAAKILNLGGAPNIREEHAQLSQRVSEARKIITMLLLVLHEHSGSKRAVADKARDFLGLKRGAKIGSLEDKLEVMYGLRS